MDGEVILVSLEEGIKDADTEGKYEIADEGIVSSVEDGIIEVVDEGMVISEEDGTIEVVDEGMVISVEDGTIEVVDEGIVISEEDGTIELDGMNKSDLDKVLIVVGGEGKNGRDDGETNVSDSVGKASYEVGEEGVI